MGEPDDLKKKFCEVYAGADRRGEIAGAEVYYKVDDFGDISVWWIIYNLNMKQQLRGLVETFIRYVNAAIVVFSYDFPEIHKVVPEQVKYFWGISGLKPVILTGIKSENANEESRKLLLVYINGLSKIIRELVAFIEIDPEFKYEDVRAAFESAYELISS